jgi:hypothetical protein
MQIPVLLEPIPGNRYRARSGEPLVLSAEGRTRAEALHNLELLVSQRLAASQAEIAHIDVSAVSENPWRLYAGSLPKDDPMVQEWIQIMEENRRKADEDPELP